MGRCLVVLSLLGGCFSPQFDECAIQCGVGCPTGWTCGGDGFCHGSSDGKSCTSPPDAEIDASVPTEPDGAAVSDAAPSFDAQCGRVDLIANGNFDDSTGTGSMKTVPGWMASGFLSSIVLHESQGGAVVHSPAYAAEVVNDNGQVREMCQRFTGPVGASALQVSLFFKIETDEQTSDPFDILRVQLRSPAGTILAEPVTLTNLSATASWLKRDEPIDLDVGGQTLDLCIKASNDSVDPTTFHLDDFSLTAYRCP